MVELITICRAWERMEGILRGRSTSSRKMRRGNLGGFFFSALVLGTLAARYSPGDFVEGAMPLSFDRRPPLLKSMVILPQIISSLVHL